MSGRRNIQHYGSLRVCVTSQNVEHRERWWELRMRSKSNGQKLDFGEMVRAGD